MGRVQVSQEKTLHWRICEGVDGREGVPPIAKEIVPHRFLSALTICTLSFC